MLSDKYPPFDMLKERRKVLHLNVCCRAPFFVSVASLLKGCTLKKCSLLHIHAAEYLYCTKQKKQSHKCVILYGRKNPGMNLVMRRNDWTTISAYGLGKAASVTQIPC